MTQHQIPVLMRDDTHNPIVVGNAIYNDRFETLTFRVSVKATDGLDMTMAAIGLGLVEALQFAPVMGVYAAEVVEASEANEESAPAES